METKGPQMTSQYGAYALRTGLARLYARTRMHTPRRPVTRTHTRTRKHSHTEQYVILIAFPQKKCFRERAYTYIACLVIHNFRQVTSKNYSCHSHALVDVSRNYCCVGTNLDYKNCDREFSVNNKSAFTRIRRGNYNSGEMLIRKLSIIVASLYVVTHNKIESQRPVT